MLENRRRIDRLEQGEELSREELALLLSTYDEEDRAYAAKEARSIALRNFGNKVYFRGLIEISNYCKNNCYYCGIRRSNGNASRYRLSPEEILTCCRYGYEAGFRTFVLQGGEDPWWTDDRMVSLVSEIKRMYPDCAVTLSLGEKERESYQRLFDAGADRYLLRHETADREHYGKLHPSELSLENRKRCLKDLIEIGYQTGCGCMVGSPYQTAGNLAEDLIYMKKLRPQMIGVGPFIPHKDTPFRDFPPGTLEDTLFLLSLIRIMHPWVLLPATTALGTIQPDGREQGILAGANVVMPNISPEDARRRYLLYDRKVDAGADAVKSRLLLQEKIEAIGYEVVVGRGDYKEDKES